MKNWKYYNHAMIPTTAPHEEVDIQCIKDKSIWKENKKALFARWTSDFDCGYETTWWYVIKDEPFDISSLKAKRRYEINKGRKNFEVHEINPKEYAEEIFDVTVAAYSSWPEKYRPNVEREKFVSSVNGWNWYKVLGAFSIEDNALCAYALLSKKNNFVEFCVLRVKPECERLGINAAVVAEILDVHKEFLENGGYICDGARSINHETAFQDYLEKYFGFRKAYCHLNIEYKPIMKLLINVLYSFRSLLLKLDYIGIVHQVNAVLKMEEICKEK